MRPNLANMLLTFGSVRSVLIWLGICAMGAPSHGGPVLNVRTRGAIVVQGMHDNGSHSVVTGWVRDMDGAGLANVRLSLTWGDEQRLVVTDLGGAFDAEFSGAQPTLMTAEILDDAVDADVLSTIPQALPVPTGLTLQFSTRDDAPEALLEALRAPQGVCSISIDEERAGTLVPGVPFRIVGLSPGEHLAVATCLDAQGNAGESVSAWFTVAVQPTLRVSVADGTVVRGETLQVSADLRPAGKGARATIWAKGNPIATMDLASGRAQASLDTAQWSLGVAALTVTTDALPTLREATASATVRVVEETPFPTKTLLVVLGLFTIVALLRNWLGDRRQRPLVTVGAAPRPAIGFASSSPNLAKRLLTAAKFEMSFVVVDVDRERPVQACLTWQNASVTTDAAGAVTIQLPGGTFSIAVTAEGYMPVECSFRLPHRGEYDNQVIGMRSIRDHVFELYRPTAMKHLPRPSLWSIWSPREIFAQLRGKASTPSMRELTEAVEQVYFGGTATLPEVSNVITLIERVHNERAPTL